MTACLVIPVHFYEELDCMEGLCCLNDDNDLS